MSGLSISAQTTKADAAMSTAKIPLVVKIGFTAFMALLVPYYWKTYGATNFLYFCDIALFLTLAAVWTERAVLASMAAVGICAVQVLWQVDFLAELFGMQMTGLTGYMFNEEIPLFARFLSFFHFWLPLLVIYLVWKLGYDRRGLVGWTVIAWLAMAISYLFLPAPGDTLAFTNQPYNVNYVYGLGTEAQTMMPEKMWLASLMIGLPAIIYTPSHFAFRKLFTKPEVESC